MTDKAIFNCKSHEIYDLLAPCLDDLSQSDQNELQYALISNGINGESLIFMDQTCLTQMNITNPYTQMKILNTINTLYNYRTFSKYISSFDMFSSFKQFFINTWTDLQRMRNEGHTKTFYSDIGASNLNVRTFINTFRMLFSTTINCCNDNCKKLIAFDNKTQFDSFRNNKHKKK
eukprot:37564_1